MAKLAQAINQQVTALTDTKMGIDRGVTGGTRQILILPVRNVQMGLGVTVLLGQTEINDVDLGPRLDGETRHDDKLTWLPRLPIPMRKLSGLMSRWMKLRE